MSLCGDGQRGASSPDFYKGDSLSLVGPIFMVSSNFLPNVLTPNTIKLGGSVSSMNSGGT